MKSIEDFRRVYREMPDYQILQIASEAGLVPEASQALSEELAVRGIALSDIDQHIAYVGRQTMQKNIENNLFFVPHGVGIAFRGSRFSSNEDKKQGIQLRTKWFILFWIPLIPIGSYRIRYGKTSSTFLSRTVNYQVVSKEKLNMMQVMVTWTITFLVVALLLGVISQMK